MGASPGIQHAEKKDLRVDRAVRMVTVENRTGGVFFLKIYPDKVSLFPRKPLSVQKFYSLGLPGKGCQGTLDSH